MAEMGHELRRPEADYLRNEIYELRAAFRRIQYRMLYFFYEEKAVVSHGLIKQKVVEPKEIELAVDRKERFKKDSVKYAFKGGELDE